MARLSDLEAEINAMEEGVFSNPTEVAAENTEVDQTETVLTETVATEESQETASLESNKETETNSPSPDAIVETVTIEDTPTDESTSKPKRNNWKKEAQTLQKRYNNLKASQDNTIHQLRVENAQLQKGNADLSKENLKLQNDVRDLKAKAIDPFADVVSAEEVDVLGEETLDSMKKVTRAAIDNAVTPLQAELDAERQARINELETKAVQAKEQSQLDFRRRLGEIVPDFAELDTNPDFLTWMNGVDEYSGEVRKEIFKRAHSYGDVGRVASFFDTYKKLNVVVAPTPDPLEDKVTPKPAASSPVTQPNEDTAPQITQAFVDKFYNDASRGLYRGRENERLEIEKKIDRAFANREIIF